MKSYLKSLGLWNAVETGNDSPPLRVNPTLAQIKKYEEEKLKKDKALTFLHTTLSDHIFTTIMDLESAKKVWDKLKEEHDGSDKVKAVKLLTLKREFELMRMKDSESIKDYSNKLMNLVNQIRLHGEMFPDQKVVEKIMVSVPKKFEAKISAIKESCDMKRLSIAELVGKLHAQEQRASIRVEEPAEGAFQAKHKSKKYYKKHSKDKRSKNDIAEGSSDVQKKDKFPLCGICKRKSHSEKDC
ncbi:hypothetical protein ACOSP7_014766 [Xanthoceras sorbifolium]